MADFEKAAELAPDDARTYGSRALARLARDDFDGALADVSKAVELAPDNATYHIHRGEIHRLRKEFDQALTDQSRALALEPENPEPYRYRALAYAAKGDLQRAIADDTAGLKLASGKLATAILRHRALLFRRKGESERAISDYDELIRRNPQDASAYCERGRTAATKGDRRRAMADYNRAIEIDSKDSWAYLNRANLRSSLADYRGALADYDAAIRSDPDEPGAHNSRAWFLATCPEAAHRDGKQAITGATRACELSHFKDYLYVDTLAAAHAEMGEFDKAIRWQRKALELLPKDSKERSEMEDRLKLYQNKAPYREKPPTAANPR